METFDKKTPPTTSQVTPPLKEENKKSVSHKVGDAIEDAGTSIANAGAEKLGNAIYKAGDKIEHMNEDKKPKH